MSTSTRTPEYSQAQIVKPFKGFESKYEGLPIVNNPIAIPGNLDAMAGKPGYDPNLLAGIPVPLGAKIYIWLPWFAPSTYGDGAAESYRYKLVWRLRSLADQVADVDKKLAAHFGRLLPGVAQEPRTIGGSPSLIAASATLAGPRYVIPTAFESVQIVNNKFFIADVSGTDMPIQKGTDNSSGVQLGADLQEPAKIAVVSAETNTFRGNYQAPLSPNYPTNWGGGIGPKVAAAGLLSQGYYPDQAGWAFTVTSQNAGYAAGSQAVIYETEVKGDELILLLDRPDGAVANWDFAGEDRNVSRIFGTDAGTRAEIPTLGVYILTGSGVGTGQSYG